MQDNIQSSMDMIEARLNLLREDKFFRRYCKMLSKNKEFGFNMKMCQKIAKLDITDVKPLRDLLYIKPDNYYTDEEFFRGIYEFFRTIDALSPEGESLEKIVADNIKHLEIVVKQEDYRSFCAANFDRKDRKISVNIEGRINDIIGAIHELVHSASGEFRNLCRRKDIRMSELMPVIADGISPMVLAKIFPHFKENFKEARLEREGLYVIKARKCLVEAMIIKMMLGKANARDVIDIYTEFFGDNMIMASIIQKEIMDDNFAGMFEANYLLPQAASLEIEERFAANPQENAKLFKMVLLADDRITLDEGLKLLRLPDKDKLINLYVQKFPERIEKFKADDIEAQL